MKSLFKNLWIFRSFWALLKLNGGIFNMISITAGIENLIDFPFPICPCSVLSAQPYLLLQQTWWKTLWRTSGIFIVAYERINIRGFFSASPELAWILPSCVTSSKLKLWDDQDCLSFRRWMEWHNFDLKSAQLYHCQIEGDWRFFWHTDHNFSPVSAGCQICFAYQGNMSLVKRTWWETAIIYFSWHICSCPFKKWNVNWSYNHLQYRLHKPVHIY